jgi:hypothetical protein
MMEELVETCRKLRDMSLQDIRRAEKGEYPFPPDSKEAREWIEKHREAAAEMERLIEQYASHNA